MRYELPLVLQAIIVSVWEVLGSSGHYLKMACAIVYSTISWWQIISLFVLYNNTELQLHLPIKFDHKDIASFFSLIAPAYM